MRVEFFDRIILGVLVLLGIAAFLCAASLFLVIATELAK
jgi:hypothetical protein